ncbi:MAG TPA: hypothetical protein VFS83_01285 [Ktedonobacterales bacterium]|nr:hypothetical protein [Ktedonobacterales bacterium]
MVAINATRSLRYAGWAAYISAGLAIIGAIALLLFYGLEFPQAIATGSDSPQFFGPLSDYAGLFQFLAMLPLTVALHQLAPAHNQRLSRVAEILGITGLLTAALAQFLLVAHIIDFTVNLPIVLVGMVFIGIWLVVANRLGRASGALSRRLTLLGMFTGAMFAALGGLTLLMTLAYAVNPTAIGNLGTFLLDNPVLIGAIIVLFTPALFAYFIGVPIWLIGIGRRLIASDEVGLARRDEQVSYGG